jgi:hypothetical protein
MSKPASFKFRSPPPLHRRPLSSQNNHPLYRSIPLLAVLITLSFALYQGLHFLPLPAIDCLSQYGTCPDHLTRYLHSYEGRSLISSIRAIPTQLPHQHPGTQILGWHFTFPTHLQLVVQLPKATFALQPVLADSSPDPHFTQLVLIDSQGQIVSFTPDSQLPQLSVINLSWDTHLRLPRPLVTGTQIVRLLLNQSYHFHQAQMDTHQLTISLPSNKPGSQDLTVIFPLDQSSPDQLVTALHLILTRSTIDTSQISQIDLRYSKPVVTTY